MKRGIDLNGGVKIKLLLEYATDYGLIFSGGSEKRLRLVGCRETFIELLLLPDKLQFRETFIEGGAHLYHHKTTITT